MENAEQWEDVKARSEALRRRLVAEEEVELSPGKGVSIDRREATLDPIEDEEDAWVRDLFAPMKIDDASRARLTKKPTIPDAEVVKAKRLEWEKYLAEHVKSDEQMGLDHYAIGASKFRDDWNALWSRYYGPFEANTEICSMRFTDEPAPYGTNPCETLQIFSAKVTGLGGGLKWPLDVFGMVAIRDNVDHRRNIVFDRKRDNCQTLTEKDPCLVLTGPTRAVVLMDPVTIEVKLLVKGTVESEDKVLSYLAEELVVHSTLYSELLNRDYPCKLSTLEFTFGHIHSSVEATIFLQVIDGSWSNAFAGRFAARTTSIDQEVVLLHSGDKIVPFTDDGNVKLSRCVVSAELNRKLQVSVKAWEVDTSGKEKIELLMCGDGGEDCADEGGVHAPTLADNSVETNVFFTPKNTGRSNDTLDIGFCKIKVTVAWSLIWRDLF